MTLICGVDRSVSLAMSNQTASNIDAEFARLAPVAGKEDCTECQGRGAYVRVVLTNYAGYDVRLCECVEAKT